VKRKENMINASL